MRLQSIRIAGYQGIHPETPVELGDLAKLNVIVGPNNTGKSTIVRALRLAARAVINQGQIGVNTELRIEPSAWWQGDQDFNPEIIVGFAPVDAKTAALDTPVRLRMSREKLQLRFRVLVQSETRILCGPEAVLEDGSLAWHAEPGDDGLGTFLRSSGERSGHISVDDPLFSETAPLMVSWARGCLFLDAIRSLRIPLAKSEVNDGSGLLADLQKMQRTPETSKQFDVLEAGVLSDINPLLEKTRSPRIRSLDLKGEVADNAALYVRVGPESSLSIDIQNMGTGIAQLVLLFAYIRLHDVFPTTLVLEEPETHLHPSLLVELVRNLQAMPNLQVFLTTHSNTILDCLDEDSRVYETSMDPEGACQVRSVRRYEKLVSVLDNLGVTASSILQANCVIWVEGPSDRLYVRHWLNLAAAARGEQLSEGVDYTFAFYGGSVLAHFDLEDPSGKENDLASMLAPCRFAVVLMDSDRNSRTKPLSEAKRRVLDSAAEDETHRFACVTNGHEIEDDVDVGLMVEAGLEMLGRERGRSKETKVGPRYWNRILSTIEVSPTEKRQLAERLKNKVSLARQVVKVAAQSQNKHVPDYADKMFDLVVRARGS